MAESWNPPKKNFLCRSLILKWWCFRGDPRGIPQFWWKLFPIREVFAHWLSCGCPLTVQVPPSWVPVLCHEMSLSWSWTEHPVFRAMIMATERQGFFFVFIKNEQETHCTVRWNISIETCLPGASCNEKWNSWHLYPGTHAIFIHLPDGFLFHNS